MKANATSSEWECCEALGGDRAQKLLDEHRRTYFRREDFAQMRAAGVTHVRLPFGAWCIQGPRPGEPYVGPCLEALDKALDLIESEGLRVVLDLHGTVGGENAEAPCGRINPKWKPEDWDPTASLAVVRIVAERYANRISVCGFGVLNEPAECIPAKRLAKYYEDCVQAIRQAGMKAGEVSVVLPIYTEGRLEEFLKLWEANFDKYEDCVFDLHFYQCFGVSWTIRSLQRHLKQALLREQILNALPTCCVSEWSLALPDKAKAGLCEDELQEAYKAFAQNQLTAYETATHGWFFWTWKDGAGVEWCLKDALERGLLEIPSK